MKNSQKHKISNLFKVFIATALLSTACGKSFEVFEGLNPIQQEVLADQKTKLAERKTYLAVADENEFEASGETVTEEKSDSAESISDEQIVADFKEQLEKVIELMSKIDTTDLPAEAIERLEANKASAQEMLDKVNDQTSLGEEFRSRIVALRRAAEEQMNNVISDEQKAIFWEQACLVMGTILEKDEFPSEGMREAVQHDFDLKCQ